MEISLYSISPSDIVKFVTPKYVPLPKKWGDATNEDIKNAAVDGKIETVLLNPLELVIHLNRWRCSRTNVAKFSINVPIIGDGQGLR